MVTNPLCSNNGAGKSIKLLCSYGGKILPRPVDGELRYVGGETRVVSVDRSITFAELLVKLGELCGSSVSLRCQFPMMDLDALVSITCDEDLANLIEEYDRANKAKLNPLKIRAFLSPPKSIKKISPPPSVRTCTCIHQMSKPPVKVPVYPSKLDHYVCLPPRNPNYSHIYPGNCWQ